MRARPLPPGAVPSALDRGAGAASAAHPRRVTSSSSPNTSSRARPPSTAFRTKRLAEDARAALLAYPWPGNVRELANVLERVMLLEDGPVITAAMLSLLASTDGSARRARSGILRSPEALRADERQQLVAALNAARGNITRAAARLGIHRNTMRYRLTKHELIPRGTRHRAPAPRERVSVVASSSPPTPVPAKAIRWEERLVAVARRDGGAVDGGCASSRRR